jgi:DNA polymerase/3'-5' exonuclease PolX
MSEYTIFLSWDDEARVWFTKSDDIPGLLLCDASVDALIEESESAASELLELSGTSPHNVKLRFLAERESVVA